MKIDGIGPEARQHRHRAHDLRLLLSGRRQHSVRVDPQGERRMSAETELRARLRLADLRRLRHLPRQSRRLESAAADDHARIRRRGDDRPRRRDRVHQRARRRHGDLHDEGGRLRRPPADQQPRSRRRAVLLVGRQAHRLSRPPARGRHGADRLPRPAEGPHLAADQARDLRDGSRRREPTPGDDARRPRALRRRGIRT